MPRNHAVDYPQIPHRPTAYPGLGLAPPPAFADLDRYSWQVTPVEDISSSREEQFEAANKRRKQLEQRETQSRQSRIPPLPVLPDHLTQDSRRDVGASIYELLPSQKRDRGFAQTQQQPNHAWIEEQETEAQFLTDLPHQYQSQPRANPHEHSLAASYEQSQHLHHQSRTAEHPTISIINPQSYAHTVHLPNAQHRPSMNQIQGPEEQKIPLPTISTQHHPQMRTAQIGPDENPLTATSASSVNLPVNTRPINGTMAVLPEMHFSQSTHFTQQTSQGSTWHHSLASCADPTTCLSSLFCPCMIYGRTQHRLSLKSVGKDSTNMLGFSSLNGSCLAWSILPGINVLLTAIQHRRIRKAYNMEGQAGNFIGDCVKGVCCCCCMLAQAEKEMKAREVSVARITDEYKSPADMIFIPQAR